MANKAQTIKIQIKAGAANPAPPIGTVLGPTGIAIADFCKQFNDQTRDLGDSIIPTIITIKEDRSFSFIMKTPPASYLIKKHLKLKKGSSTPNSDKIGSITDAQLAEIAAIKMVDLNARDPEAAKKIIAGTAIQMGLTIEK